MAFGADSEDRLATGLAVASLGAGVWFRAAGDGVDLALLGLAARSTRQDVRRLVLAAAMIGTIAGLDVYAAIRLGRGPTPDPADDLSNDPAYEPPDPFKGIKGG